MMAVRQNKGKSELYSKKVIILKVWEILHLVCIFVNNNKGLQQNSLKKKKFKTIFFELVPTWYSGILESLHMVLTWLLVSVRKQKG